MTEPAENNATKRAMRAAEKAAAAAVGVNALLTGSKFVLAWLSGSLSLKVEAFHSFADIGSSLAVFLAVRSEFISRMNGEDDDKSFFNPQRTVSIGIGLFLAVVGALFLRRVITPEPISVNYPVPVAIAMLVLALFSFLLSRYERLVGERESSTALVADSFHARVDMFGSLVVAAALLGESLGLSLDRWAALALALYILSQAVNVFGAVIRDVVKRTDQAEETEILYREWLFRAFTRRLPGLTPRLVSLVSKSIGGDPEDPSARKKAGTVLWAMALAALIVIWLLSGLYSVGAGEKAVVERFGRPINAGDPYGPGAHWAWPWPIDRVSKVDVKKIRSLSVGSEIAPGKNTVLWTNAHYVEQFQLLSGENTFIDVGVAVHYRVDNVEEWLYSCRDPELILEAETYAALTQVFAGREFLPSITDERDQLEDSLEETVVAGMGPHSTGIKILSVQVRDAHPPTEVAAEFEKVISAMIEYETLINEARGYYNDVLPRAEGEAAAKEKEALAYRYEAVARAKGRAARFEDILKGHRLSPAVYRDRIRIETMESTLAGREKILVPEKAISEGIEVLLTKDPGVVPGAAQ